MLGKQKNKNTHINLSVKKYTKKLVALRQINKTDYFN